MPLVALTILHTPTYVHFTVSRGFYYQLITHMSLLPRTDVYVLSYPDVLLSARVHYLQ